MSLVSALISWHCIIVCHIIQDPVFPFKKLSYHPGWTCTITLNRVCVAVEADIVKARRSPLRPEQGERMRINNVIQVCIGDTGKEAKKWTQRNGR
jgi:hypothetical protein